VGSAYKKPIELTKKYSKADLSVLFIGDPGVGKEEFAKLYMSSSERKGRKMTVDCAAWPDQLLRSEVFGHVKGAYTDAVIARKGKLLSCENGILFLDELGDATPEFQAAILRVAQGDSFFQLGSDIEIKDVNTRIIAATNKPAKVRQDLKDRFSLVPVPPLQRGDIPEIAESILGRPLKEKVMEALIDRPYPDNVRGLQKLCLELNAKEGDKIFGNRASKPNVQGDDFDYDRYCNEISAWNRHMQSLVEKYNLGFRYKYFAPPPDDRIDVDMVYGRFRGGGLLKREFDQWDKQMLIQSTNEELEHNPLFVPGMIRLTDLLNQGIQKIPPSEVDLLPWFKNGLRTLFESESLPYFLRTVERLETDEPADIYPDLSYLLKLPLAMAAPRFEWCYLEFHSKQCTSQKDTALRVGLNPNTLRSKLTRLRKELSKEA
jgi:hypothetical protein